MPKLPSKDKRRLQELNIEHTSNEKMQNKYESWEKFGVIAGAVGVVILIASMASEDSGAESILPVAIIAIAVGAWCYFAPPSQKENSREKIIANRIQEELAEMGYDPNFSDERVALAGSDEFLNVHEDNNYE